MAQDSDFPPVPSSANLDTQCNCCCPTVINPKGAWSLTRVNWPTCVSRAAQDLRPTPQGPNLSFRYDYDSRGVEDVEKSGASLSPETFLDSMRQAQPNFDAFLSRRHGQLRHLYRLFLKRHPTRRRRSREIDADVPDAFQDSPPEPVRAELTENDAHRNRQLSGRGHMAPSRGRTD
jgi:hypothetical protein